MPEGDAASAPKLRRTLGRWQLTLLGVSNAVGSGVLVLSGTMAANYAGPSAALSFALAGLVCLIVAFCYAELAAMMPEAGSAYSYARRSTNPFISWLVGWCLILGYLVAASTVAVGWSGYFVKLLDGFGIAIPHSLQVAPIKIGEGLALESSGGLFNLPAIAIVGICSLFLVRGVKESATFNTVMVSLKLAAIGIFLVIGIAFINPNNWEPFIPPNKGTFGQFGVSGIFAAALLAFFAYTGFEVISTSTQEAKYPDRDIPFALMASFWLCAIIYIAVALVLTGLVPFALLNHPSPVPFAIEEAAPAFKSAGFIITTLIVVGLPSAVLVSLYGQTRIFKVMSDDGMLPPIFGRISPRSQTPVAGTAIVGVVAAIMAGLLPLEILGELVSMGLLFCFMIVCVAVIILRRREPNAPRPYRVPLYPATPIVGALACAGLVFSLPMETWSRLAIWLAAGAFIYFASGHARRSV
jgi:basic amino acid/polyamine antiporter, APA family